VKVPVRSGKTERPFSIEFAETFPAALVNEWTAFMSVHCTGAQQDTIEFLESVVAKWSLYDRKNRVARSSKELLERVKRENNAEVLCVLTASAQWYRGGALAGFCQFRRTWCNNVVFDFLGIHPHVIGTREISGIGTALLIGLALIARDLNAGIVWAETTDTSISYYERIFNLPSRSDLLLLDAERFCDALIPMVADRIE
jgi:hypothetical protein